MLLTLQIKNFALISSQTIDFKNGFNVLVGETGSGKSLILDALSFVMGEKANKLNIRHGQQKMSVSAMFENNEHVLSILKENDIDADDYLIISRSLTIDGKCDSRINGNIATAGLIKQFASALVDVCAQNENIELLKAKNHLSILDKYAGEKYGNLKNEISDLLDEIKSIDAQMEVVGVNDELRARKLDILKYQIDEITNANLKNDEDVILKEEISKMANFEKISQGISLSSGSLSSVSSCLSECSKYLSSIERFDTSISAVLERVNACSIEIDDINDTLSNFGCSDYNEIEFDNLNKRQDEINILKKKYGNTIADIKQYLESITNEYDDLLFGEEKLIKLNKERNKLNDSLFEKCLSLSLKRREVALDIEQKVLNELMFLGFKDCKFKVMFNDIPSDSSLFKHSKNGFDDIEFLFTANAGEELKSLSKTISGGEMSRFMLSLKSVFANCFESSTLIFDEIDTGISGETGQKIAERLAMLSKKYQLVCITHLCQVSAMADNYIHVSKTVEDGATYTIVKYLNKDETIKHLAIISGAEPTDVAIKFATELKQNAENYKKNINNVENFC